jgi:ABC-type Zn uptake system ZnuABC Zn-binding protein ZnuA
MESQIRTFIARSESFTYDAKRLTGRAANQQIDLANASESQEIVATRVSKIDYMTATSSV